MSIDPINLLKKIYAGGETICGQDYDAACYGAILRNWNDEFSFKQKMIYEAQETSAFFDKFYRHESFFDKAVQLISNCSEDTYFSINTFWRTKKETAEVRHLNAFALDFDFYKKRNYKHLTPMQFYQVIKKKLPMQPTAVIDSGRGLYVLYCFGHCSKERTKLYKAIYQAFYERFKEFGMDAAAMAVTQVIRLPGTINSKNLKEVEILEFNDTEYELTDFCSLLKYSQQEVSAYNERKKSPDLKKDECSYKPKYSSRRAWVQRLRKDFEQLIVLRNNQRLDEGYREILIYLLRERLIWAGYSIEEALRVAHRLNRQFISPLSIAEVEKQCAPTMHAHCNSVSTMIVKLKVTPQEQMKMQLLIKKGLRDKLSSQRQRRHKLLNRTEKELRILERRTHIFKLKREGKSNARIADILEVNRSTISRDLEYIDTHRWEFKIELTEVFASLSKAMHVKQFLRSIPYEIKKRLEKWLEISPEVLDLSG